MYPDSSHLPQINRLFKRYQARASTTHYRTAWQRFHLDAPLLCGIILLLLYGLLILYSASNENLGLIDKQLARLGLAFFLMLVFAQIPPLRYRLWAPWIFGIGITLLIMVLGVGVIGKGAQRWLNVGLFRFQPSEILKIAVPMMVAWFFHRRPLPPSLKHLAIAATIIMVPALLIAKQPDLGTALMIIASGACVLFLAGVSFRLIFVLGLMALVFTPVLWHFMHGYQRQRVLTFLNPERDPLGAGYHIIQSKIAIGSGGLFGKGWLHGTQSHLNFLPEHATDFIFAVCGEEFGLLGNVLLLILYLFIVGRALYISAQAQDTFSRLLAGGLALSFFLAFFVNIGMVIGILPVVGLPLPLVSYGGTAVVTQIASFGIIMSIHTHRTLHRT